MSRKYAAVLAVLPFVMGVVFVNVITGVSTAATWWYQVGRFGAAFWAVEACLAIVATGLVIRGVYQHVLSKGGEREIVTACWLLVPQLHPTGMASVFPLGIAVNFDIEVTTIGVNLAAVVMLVVVRRVIRQAESVQANHESNQNPLLAESAEV